MNATTATLDAQLDTVAAAPSLSGTVVLLVARPAVGERQVLDSAELSPGAGLVGDNYVERGSTKTPDGRAHLDTVAAAPSLSGTVVLLVARPAVGERQVLDSAELSPGSGLVGDNYVERGSTKTPDGRAHPLAELNVMSSRSLEAVAGPDRARWALAGDQLIVDFDLSLANAPSGTRLQVGSAVIEVTTKPHTGCSKFSARFGIDAARWVNSRDDLRLRGICAVVVRPGTVATGDPITKIH